MYVAPVRRTTPTSTIMYVNAPEAAGVRAPVVVLVVVVVVVVVVATQ